MRAKPGRNVRGDRKAQTREYLLRHPDFVAKKDRSSLEGGQTDWEASTLPLSYTR